MLLVNFTNERIGKIDGYSQNKHLFNEKSLTEKKFTDKQTFIITEKAKTIYPLYTLYRGYKKGCKPISLKVLMLCSGPGLEKFSNPIRSEHRSKKCLY